MKRGCFDTSFPKSDASQQHKRQLLRRAIGKSLMKKETERFWRPSRRRYPNMRWVLCRSTPCRRYHDTIRARRGLSDSIKFRKDTAKAFIKKQVSRRERRRGPEGCDTFLDLQETLASPHSPHSPPPSGPAARKLRAGKAHRGPPGVGRRPALQMERDAGTLDCWRASRMRTQRLSKKLMILKRWF